MATRVQPRSYRNSYRNPRQGRESNSSQGSFFLGNIDKELTREQVYECLRNIKNPEIYISKFDMPKVEVGSLDDHGRPINCAGYAFVHTRTLAQAQAMLRKKTIRIGKLNAEIKHYDQAKREISQTRHRERQASLSLSRAETPDWTVTDNGNWEANILHQAKLISLEPDSFAIESAYVSDANDETMSLSQSVVNSEHGMPVEQMSSTSRRRPESKLNMGGDSKKLDKMVMRALLDDDITPTAERVDAKLQEFMRSVNNTQMVPIQENNNNFQQHVEDSHVYNPSLNLENPATNNVLINQQAPLTTATATDNILQTNYNQPLLPFQLNTAPATLQLPTPTPLVTLPTHFTQSPVYLTIMAEAARLQAQHSNDQIYQNCYNLWYNYYQNLSCQDITALFNTSANEYHESLSQKVEQYTRL